jgi:protein polybromo-1
MGKRGETVPRRRLKREETYDQVDMCQNLFDALKAAKDVEGKPVAELFMRVPSRRTDPEYYEIVREPMDFTRINQKLRAYEYKSFNDFCKDIELLIGNAHQYYKPDSQEFLSATQLQKAFYELKGEHASPSASAENSPSPNFGEKATTSPGGIPDEVKLEHILSLILALTDRNGRLLSPPFRVLVAPEKLPEYYEIVLNPVDFKTIASKIRSGAYKTWSAFEDDIQLLVNNCKKFNPSTSQIYKDAVKINSFYEQKKAEISSPRFVIEKSKIAENKRLIKALMEQTESNDNSELSEDSEEDEESERNSSPLWVLYWSVRNLKYDAKNPAHRTNIADPFLELPNKQHYPDYYDEIQNPMSLYVINKRLKHGFYKSLQGLVDDLLLICYNSRCYNMESSDFYIAACKLEAFISKKAKELDPSISINIEEVPLDDEEMPEEDEELDDDEEEEEQPKPERKKRPHVSINESDDNVSETSFIRPPSHKRRKKNEFSEFGSGTIPPRKHPQGRKSIEEHRCIYKNKLLRVFNTVRNYNLHGRMIAEPLMYVPDPKQFPDYYKTVKKPVDLTTILKNVEDFSYNTSGEFMNDLFILFNNVRQLYPPHTEIVQHANLLQETAVNTMKHITKGQVIPIPVRKERSRYPHYKRRRSVISPGNTPTHGRTVVSTAFYSPAPETKKVVIQPQRNVAEEQTKMKEVYQTIFSFRGGDKRVLADTFVKLPTRDEYPSYYEKIKRPIDLSRISTKINANHYESFKDFFADLKLVFDNACIFNDSVSTIYRDALVLQKEVQQLRNQYLNDEVCISSEIKLILMKIFVAVTTFTSNGRHLSESLDDIHKLFKKSGVPEDEFPFSLDEIKYNLDKGRYRRIDRFQEDFFYLFAKIREHAPVKSELFRDTIELQKHFIDKREEVCKNILITPAKLYSRSELEKELEIVRKRRKQKDQAANITTTEPTESEPGTEEISQEAETLNNSAESNDEAMTSINFNGKTYYPEDYVYVASADDNAPPDAPRHIMRIERIFHDEEGTLVVRGMWCYKPRETYHLATRLFFPNEVFLTPFKDTVTVDRLRGKCCVIFAEEYLKNKPEDFDDNDVYVCESKYLGRKQHFKKLPTWPYPEELEKLKVSKRSEPLKVTKVKSELAKDGSEIDISEEKKKARSESTQSKESSSDGHEAIPGVVSERVKNLPRILDIHRDEVKDTKNQKDENCIFYEQMLHNGTWYRRGDGVLAYREKAGHCDVFRIDKMWRNKE